MKSSDTPEIVCLHEFGVFGGSASLLPAQSLRATPKCAYELRKSGQQVRGSNPSGALVLSASGTLRILAVAWNIGLLTSTPICGSVRALMI